MWNLLEWLTDCSPASITMAVHQQKVQKSSSYSVHKAGGLRCSSLYTGIPKKSALTQVEKWQRTSFFLSCPLP